MGLHRLQNCRLMMKSEWREHLEHDESHLQKWGCTAMGSLTQSGQQTLFPTAPHSFQEILSPKCP